MHQSGNAFIAQLFTALLLSLSVLPLQANVASPVAANPALEKRVQAITQELRCLVCQNQTIADSHADLAIDLKNEVREKLAQGMSDDDIRKYMVDRYGDFVLYRPPVKSTTWLLWFGPFLFLIIGIAALMRKLMKRNSSPTLSEEERRRAAALLDKGAEETTPNL
jgi:cytochrome c-type biogenesis protein CcmH